MGNISFLLPTKLHENLSNIQSVSHHWTHYVFSTRESGSALGVLFFHCRVLAHAPIHIYFSNVTSANKPLRIFDSISRPLKFPFKIVLNTFELQTNKKKKIPKSCAFLKIHALSIETYNKIFTRNRIDVLFKREYRRQATNKSKSTDKIPEGYHARFDPSSSDSLGVDTVLGA